MMLIECKLMHKRMKDMVTVVVHLVEVILEAMDVVVRLGEVMDR